jgi:hypothetical protein
VPYYRPLEIERKAVNEMSIEYEQNFESGDWPASFFEAERWELTDECAQVRFKCECGKRHELAEELLNVASAIIDFGEDLASISKDLSGADLWGPADSVVDAALEANDAVRTLLHLARNLIEDGS